MPNLTASVVGIYIFPFTTAIKQDLRKHEKIEKNIYIQKP
jgi:hypothetical protein